MGSSDEDKFDHPTQKPVELMRRPILNHLRRGELVFDPFLGSGTTLATVAAGIDATRAQLGFLHPLLVTRYQNLAALYRWLNRLQVLVDAEKTARGWTPVSELTTQQRENLDAAAGETVQLLALVPPLFEADPNS